MTMKNISEKRKIKAKKKRIKIFSFLCKIAFYVKKDFRSAVKTRIR